jgi:flavin-binding protein dodecin
MVAEYKDDWRSRPSGIHGGKNVGGMDLQPRQRSRNMAEASVARITEISAKSMQGFEDAIRVGLNRAQKTLRNVTSAWIKEQRVIVDGDRLSYQVNMEVTFVLDE